jgi:hypothetical protein
MTGTPLAPALALLVSAASLFPAPAPGAPGDPDDRVERPVPFVAPAVEMRKLAALSGTWNLDETWAEPDRYKRGAYEGRPGPGGHGTLKIRPGPGGFSILCDYDARNPMGRVTALIVIAWNPSRQLYDFEEIHGAFPGVLHLTGKFESGELVFRGKDFRRGKPLSVRLVWKGLGQDAWTAVWSETNSRGRREPAVTTELRRAAGP